MGDLSIVDRFAWRFAPAFAERFAPGFGVRFVPLFAPARPARRVLPGHHSYEWHVTATTSGWYGGKSVGRC